MLVHDNCSRIKWKLAVIESLIRDSDGMVHICIRMVLQTDRLQSSTPLK